MLRPPDVVNDDAANTENSLPMPVPAPAKRRSALGRPPLTKPSSDLSA
jgi:hypothetical protein